MQPDSIGPALEGLRRSSRLGDARLPESESDVGEALKGKLATEWSTWVSSLSLLGASKSGSFNGNHQQIRTLEGKSSDPVNMGVFFFESTHFGWVGEGTRFHVGPNFVSQIFETWINSMATLLMPAVMMIGPQ